MQAVLINGASAAGAREKITDLTSATALTATTYNLVPTTLVPYSTTRRPRSAVIQVKGASINWCVDGTTPTVTAGTNVGFLSAAGEFITIDGHQNISQFRAINETASNGAYLEVVYFY